MNLQLTGFTAVVTGGSSGIGAAIVRTLADEGCHVAFCARDERRIEAMLAASAGMPGSVSAKALDCTDTPALRAWLEAIGPFDIFIPNVSALSGDWTAALATDIRATVDATEAAIPFFANSRNAAVAYIGSKAGSLATPRMVAYGAAKAAMAHYMKSLSSRLLPAVRVNTVSPGDTLVAGGFWDNVRTNDLAAFDAVVKRNPMGRLAHAEEIARVVAFVSSPAASFVSGANWYVDGGSIAHVQT